MHALYFCLHRCSVEIFIQHKFPQPICFFIFNLFIVACSTCISAWLGFDSMSPWRESFKNTLPCVSGSPLLDQLRVAQLCKCIDLWALCGWVDFPECFWFGVRFHWEPHYFGKGHAREEDFFLRNQIPSGCASWSFCGLIILCVIFMFVFFLTHLRSSVWSCSEYKFRALIESSLGGMSHPKLTGLSVNPEVGAQC